MDESNYQEEEEEGGEEKTSSECSSGCQSGWTMYLDPAATSAISMRQQYHHHQQQQQQQDVDKEEKEEEEEEEDLSMVSDASSGPPHFHEEEDDHYSSSYCGHGCSCFCSASSLLPSAAFPGRNGHSGKKKRRVESDNRISKQDTAHSSFLDNTASSPLFSFSNTSCNSTNTADDNKKKKKMKLFVEDVSELSFGFSATHQFKVSREEAEKNLW